MSEQLDRQLLALLAPGQFVSGETLADHLCMSRMAVWKRLQKMMHQWQLDIHAVRGKGYRLAAPLELLDIDSMTLPAALSAQTQLHLSLPSTNQHLLTQLQAATAHNTLQSGSSCLAEHQSAGRGRRGRQWVSPFGRNLYLSLYWRFDCTMQSLGALSMVVGTVLCRVLEQQGVQDIGLKWPNDIMLRQQKLAGILVDIHGAMDGPIDAVIGLGVNFAMPAKAAQAIDQPWSDLQALAHPQCTRNRFAGALLTALHQGLTHYAEQGWNAFVADWRRFDAYLHAPVVLTLGQKTITGIHAGIADDGALILRHNGREQLYYSGEVSLRGMQTHLMQEKGL